MSCPHCGAATRDDARFCGACGRSMSATEPTSRPNGEAPSMIGREIAGRYRILAKLGEGGMGAVFRAEQISLKRTVAVKLLRPEVVGNAMLLRRFNAEAEAVAKLNHPNTVGIYDFGQDTDGTLFIAMELIAGRSLRQVIHAEGPLPPRRALAIAGQVAASLGDAHARSIVHRDLKPDNVMLQDRGRERDVVRVLDFGIAKLRDETRATQQQMTQQGDMLGTPQYMAPEQIRGEAIDGRTDVYALGCMLYAMVTGRLPHEAETVLALLSKHLLEQPIPPSQRRPDLGLSPALDRLILGAMAKDPSARPPTMEVVGEQIAALLAAEPADPRSAAPAAAAHLAVVPVPRPDLRADTPAAASAFQPSPYAPGGAPSTPYAPGASPYASGGAPSTSYARGGAPSPYAPGASPYPGGAAYVPAHGAGPAAPFPHSAHAPGGPGAGSAAPSRRRRGARPVIIAVVVVGAAAVTVGLVARGGGAARPATELAIGAGHEPTRRDEPGPPRADPWAQSTPLDGTKVNIGQGVSLVVPPGFQISTQNGVTAALDGRGVLIAAGAIEIASNDPQELATYHARRNHLVFDKMERVFVGGVERPAAMFHATMNGVAVTHVAVPLIGPGYRVAVIMQVPKQLEDDPAIEGLALELYTRRIGLP